jgi:hypothetical protein
MSYSNHEQTVIINGYRLNGVQSVDGSYGISERPIKVAGVGFIDSIVDSPLEGNFSINRKMVSADPLLSTNSVGKYDMDEQEISGAILYQDNTKGFGFTKARVSRYSVTCSVGEIPDIQTDITVYGNLGSNVLKVDPYSVDVSSQYYPFDGDYVYNTNVQGEILDEGENLKQSWNDNSLIISDYIYNSLNPRTRDVIELLETNTDDAGGVKTENYEAYINANSDLLNFYNDPANLWDYESDGIPELIQTKTKVEFGESHWINVGQSEGRDMYYSYIKHTLGLGKDAFFMNGYGNLITNSHPQTKYPDQSSIKIKVSDFEIDAVSDFSYTRTINLVPVYAIPKGLAGEMVNNNLDPIQVDTQYPIETDINFNIIVDEYEIREIKDRLQSAPKSNVEIEILDAQDNSQVINSFTGYNVRLISESINSTIEEQMNISLTFKGYESLHNQFYLQ